MPLPLPLRLKLRLTLHKLAEIEQPTKDEMIEHWEAYYPVEREEALADIYAYARRRFRPILGKKALVERWTGEKIHIKTPEYVIRIPKQIKETQ